MSSQVDRFVQTNGHAHTIVCENDRGHQHPNSENCPPIPGTFKSHTSSHGTWGNNLTYSYTKTEAHTSITRNSLLFLPSFHPHIFHSFPFWEWVGSGIVNFWRSNRSSHFDSSQNRKLRIFIGIRYII